MKLLSLCSAIFLGLSLSGYAADDASIAIPLKGLTAKCCEQPVVKGLKSIEHVGGVTLRKKGDLYVAEIRMKGAHALNLSAVERGLDAANKEMGEAMGTKYVVDDSMGLASVHAFKTGARPDDKRLSSALSKWKGFRSVETGRDGFRVFFKNAADAPTLAEVRKACGYEVTDVLLAASKGGYRYSCPMHPETASPVPARCPLCRMAMRKISACFGLGGTKTAPHHPKCGNEGENKKKCGCCP